MKQKILDALKTKFNGVKDEILDRIAGKAAKTVTTDEELTTYIEGVTFQTIIDAESDRRATDAQKTAVANYEKKYKIKSGKPIDIDKDDTKEPPKDTDDGDDTKRPSWVQDLLDSNKALNDRLNAIEGEKVEKNRKSKLDEVLKNAPEKIKARIEKDFSRYNFKDEEDFDEWLKDTKTDVEGIANEFKTKSGIITPPKSGSTVTGSVSKDVQDRIDASKAQTTQSAIQG